MPRKFYVRDKTRRDRRAFLATPSYSGVSSPYSYSLVHSIDHLRECGWSVDWLHMEGHCHVDDARNYLVREFLESDCTDLVFLDADVGWQAEDLGRLLSFDRDVVAGIYPKKRDGADYPAMLPAGENWSDSDGLLEAERVPTGFLRIRRGVLETLHAAEKRKFHGEKDDPDRLPQAIIFERTWEAGRRISGDYSASDKIRAAGYRIFIDPEMSFVHQGEHEWSGCYGDWLREKAGIKDHRMRLCVAAMRDGTADLHHFRDMVVEYGNEAFSATPEMLFVLYQTARGVSGPMLETGTGLSSVVLATVSEMTGNPLLSLEHEKGWLVETSQKLANMGLVHRPTFAPLRQHHGFCWYSADNVPAGLALVLIDGPQRQHGRDGIFRLHGDKMKSAVLLVDDYETEGAMVGGLGRSVTVLGNQRKFAVLPPEG